MTPDNDFIGQLEDYLHEFDGVTPLPGRVRDAIRAELPSVRQAQHRPGPRRLLTMLSTASAGARFGLAAAVVVVAVVLGAAVLNNGQNRSFVGDTPTPTPLPTPAPSATLAPTPTSAPSVTAAVLTLKDAPFALCSPSDTKLAACVVPGRYQLNNWPGPGTWPATITVDVPAGWTDWDAGPGWDAVLRANAEGQGSGWGAMFYTVGDVARDPCDSTKGWIPAAQVDTPQKLAAAMAAWPRFTATAPQSVTVDGHGGVKFQLTSTAKATCASTALAGHSASGASIDVYPMVGAAGARDAATVEIIDTGNGLVVMRATDFPQTSLAEILNGAAPNPTFHAGDLADLHAILDSIRIDTPSS